MSDGTTLALAIGLPLGLLVALTIWLKDRHHRLPAPLAGLVIRSGSIWVSGIVLMTTIFLVRLLLSRRG